MLAFIYPQRGLRCRMRAPEEYDHLPFLTNVNAVEAFTGFDFITVLTEEQQDRSADGDGAVARLAESEKLTSNPQSPLGRKN